MSRTHGDLFMEIGKMVLAAHAGQSIDLTAKSEDLARRYWNLGVPADTIARAIARSVGAIGMSMAIVSHGNGHANGTDGAGDHAANGTNGANGHATNGANGHASDDANGEQIHLNGDHAAADADDALPASPAKAASALFPSGVRLAVLS